MNTRISIVTSGEKSTALLLRAGSTLLTGLTKSSLIPSMKIFREPVLPGLRRLSTTEKITQKIPNSTTILKITANAKIRLERANKLFTPPPGYQRDLVELFLAIPRYSYVLSVAILPLLVLTRNPA